MIKNIVFDIGDVLLGYRWKDMLQDYGLSEEEAKSVGQLMFEDPLWANLDLGIVPCHEVIAAYSEKYPEHSEVIAWFLTHGEYMHVARQNVWSKLPLLKERGYGIYLLSNYSEELYRMHTREADFLNYIDGRVVSYQIHIAKPEEGIYRHLFEKYQLNPSECIFFDDREANTKAARRLGMQAVTITSEEFLLQELEPFLGTN